jgi:hypothetical protein
MCSASQEAAAWQGQQMLQGVLQLEDYLSNQNWMCDVSSVGEAWPVNTAAGWWCGNVVQKCSCSPSDNCH